MFAGLLLCFLCLFGFGLVAVVGSCSLTKGARSNIRTGKFRFLDVHYRSRPLNRNKHVCTLLELLLFGFGGLVSWYPPFGGSRVSRYSLVQF